MFKEILTPKFLEFQLKNLLESQLKDIQNETNLFLDSRQDDFLELFRNNSPEKMQVLKQELLDNLDETIKIPKRLRLLSFLLILRNRTEVINMLTNYYNSVSSISAYEFVSWSSKHKEAEYMLKEIDE